MWVIFSKLHIICLQCSVSNWSLLYFQETEVWQYLEKITSLTGLQWNTEKLRYHKWLVVFVKQSTVNKTNEQLFHVFELFSLELAHIRIGIVQEHALSLPVNIATLLNLKSSVFLFLSIFCFSEADLIFLSLWRLLTKQFPKYQQESYFYLKEKRNIWQSTYENETNYFSDIFCPYIISFLVILDIILRKVIKSSKVCMRLRLSGEWNWRSVFSTENSCSIQKFDISVALGIPYQQTVNFGFLQIKKSY